MVKRDQVYLAATQKDEAAAVALAQGLERLRLPSSLSLDPSVQKLAEGRKVLRHGRENPREPRLPDLVRAKLAESAVMVLVCSSSSATSRWIRSEVEEFYRAHPRGPIIPVVLEGEPNPEKSRQAFEKPCFPDSLKRGDRDRWVDARGADWAETAPVATLAAMTGIRVEQLIFHEGMRADRMKRQRSGVLALLTLTLAFSLGWAFRWGIHEWALGNVPPYKGQIANKVERILDVTTSDREQGPMISFELTGRENETSVREISTPGQAPDRRSYPASAYGETTAFGVVPERNPEAFRIAVNAWLDEAERFLPDRSEEADRWIQSAKGSLEEQDKPPYASEWYRVHALSAVVAQRQGDRSQSREELLEAVAHWTSMPLENPREREEEAFSILATISGTSEWEDSSRVLVKWMGGLSGSESEISRRASRLLEAAESHPFLAEEVETWLAKAPGLVSPTSRDPVATSAKFALLRAEFVESQNGDAQAILEEGREMLVSQNDDASPVHQALAAQFGLRETLLIPTAAVRPETLQTLQSGQRGSSWERWFAKDLSRGWSRIGDQQLARNAYGEAIDSYNRALEFAETPHQLAEILLKSGCAYRYSGNQAGAWDAFSLAMPIFEEAGDDPSLFTALKGAILSAESLERWADLQEFKARARALESQLGDSYRTPSFWRESSDVVETVGVLENPLPAIRPAVVSPPIREISAESPSFPREVETVAEVTADVLISPSNPMSSSGVGRDVPSEAIINSEIEKVQREISLLESNERERRTIRGGEKLQGLYAELRSLLRRRDALLN